MKTATDVSAEEWRAWRSFFVMRRQLDRALERQLQQDAGVSGADYDVLISLFGADERRLRAGMLGEMLGWEKSRVSHQVTRMESRGLVERVECREDARGTWIQMTPDGTRAVLGAMRGHAAALRRYFFDVLTPDELAAMEAASRKVVDVIAPPICDTLEG